MKNRISKTQIKKALIECVFDPRNPGPMGVITDTAKSEYLELRSIELIHEARNILSQHNLESKEMYLDRLSKAIALLALAKLTQ